MVNNIVINRTIKIQVPKSKQKRGQFLRYSVQPTIQPYELSLEELKEFDYLIDGESTEEKWYDSGAMFFKYRDEIYDISNFVSIVHPGTTDPNSFCHFDHSNTFKNWDGIATDSFFSGVVIKFIDNETLRVATFVC